MFEEAQKQIYIDISIMFNLHNMEFSKLLFPVDMFIQQIIIQQIIIKLLCSCSYSFQLFSRQ